MGQDLLSRSEAADIAARADMFAAIPGDFRRQYTLASAFEDGVLILTSTRLRLGHFNSAIGLGAAGAATELQVDRILERFRRAQTQHFAIHLGEGAAPAELESWLFGRGI